MSKLKSPRGASKLTVLVFLLLLAATSYTGYRVLPIYYYYFELVNQMEQVIKVAGTEDDNSIRNKLKYHIEKLELPVDMEDLKIVREGRHLRIRMTYTEIFDIDFQGKNYVIHRFPFDAKAEGNY